MKRTCLAAAFLVLGATAWPACARQAELNPMPAVNAPDNATGTLSAQQLDELVAPLALYPDAVLADILAAATYPAEVVEAQRFASDPAHAGMDGAALTEAAAGQDWDPSVKALLMFPPVLQMMDGNLDWTEHLGRAFIAQQADVMNAVQRLRQAAEQAGTLANGPYETVVNEGGDIVISPASEQDIYLPNYQPQCVFGPDPACDGMDTGVLWASEIVLPYGFAQWGYLDWGQRSIRFNRPIRGARTMRPAPGGDNDLAGIWRHSAGRHGSAGGVADAKTLIAAPRSWVPYNHVGGYAAGAAAPVHAFAAPVFRAAPRPMPVHAAPAAAVPHAAGSFGHR